MSNQPQPSKRQYAGADWLARQLKIMNRQPASEFGNRVADLLGYVYQGLYHIKDIEYVEWDAKDRIEVRINKTPSTYDYNDLTELVFLAHRLAIRLEIRPRNYRYISILFSRRERSNDPFNGHPTIQQALAAFEANCYLPEATSKQE